jgi:acyl-CoA thioester hydrolase
MSNTAKLPLNRSDYPHFLPIQSRWNDMDKYGHINNMVYYGYFDTVVTDYIVRIGKLDTDRSAAVALVVESHCNYHRPLSFPAIIECGLRIGKLGTSSVRYEIGVFSRGDATIAADGHFIHVFVDRETMRPTPIPTPMRQALAPLVIT